jgi:hypothetical protein
VVREGVGQRGEMIQALYAHMNNKRKKKERVREGTRTLKGTIPLKNPMSLILITHLYK